MAFDEATNLSFLFGSWVLKGSKLKKMGRICEFGSDLLLGFAAWVRSAKDQQFKSGRLVLDGRAEFVYPSSPLQEKKESCTFDLLMHICTFNIYNTIFVMRQFHGVSWPALLPFSLERFFFASSKCATH